jgi:hypothetical protein
MVSSDRARSNREVQGSGEWESVTQKFDCQAEFECPNRAGRLSLRRNQGYSGSMGGAQRRVDPWHLITGPTMRIFLAAVLALTACSGALAQANASAGSPPSPATLPQDRHEGMSVSVDSWTQIGRAKDKFGKANPLPVGILPVEVFLHNETTQPLKVDLSTIQLEVHFQSGKHQDIDWVAVQEVANEIAHPNGPPGPQARRFPIGVPSGADKKADKLAEILKPLSLDADILPPMSTMHGFLFFDLNHDLSLADGASLYVPDVTNIPASKPLMFFEVPLGAHKE